VLDVLAYLAPDAITKQLLSELLRRCEALRCRCARAMAILPAAAAGVAVAAAAASRRPAVALPIALCGSALMLRLAYSQPSAAHRSPEDCWALLKSFCVLHSCGLGKRGAVCSTASVHRLLQAVIRSDHSPARARACVAAAAASLHALWPYSPADPATWAASGLLVEHIKALSRAAAKHRVCCTEAAPPAGERSVVRCHGAVTRW